MISELETSPTSRANCMKCNKKINKGELRGKIFDTRFNGYHFVCKDCAYKQIIEDIAKLGEMKQELEISQGNALN